MRNLKIFRQLGKDVNRKLYCNKQTELLAFVHIEKAAGTTLMHILRTNFFMSYSDVRPLSAASCHVFSSRDLQKIFIMSPGLKCIAGHSIRPFSDLTSIVPNVRYITLLRDPVQRYISQYQYWVENMGKKLSFDEFIGIREISNFQTRKIAGSEDVELAKDILANKFFLVGFVEEFDAFLMLLKHKLKPFDFRPGYQRQNVGARNSMLSKFVKSHSRYHMDDILKANCLDIELYEFVKKNIWLKEKKEYGLSFDSDLKAFKAVNKGYSYPILRYIDYLVRKCYYIPITNIIRKRNGLSSWGSY